jgi:hypothetical protein
MKFHYEKPPMVVATLLDGSDINLHAIKKEGKAIIEVSNHTKTQLHLSMRRGEYVTGMNFIPEKSQKFKFAEKTEMNYFQSKVVTKHYFKLSKSQNKAALEQHIANLLEQVLQLDNEAGFEVTVWDNTGQFI